MSNAFYTFDGTAFHSTELTRGPWDNGVQHGGPPSALLARALTTPDMFLARLAVSLLRPVPIARLTVEVEPGRGRTALRSVARLLHQDTVVAEARGISIRRLELAPNPGPPAPPWPGPEECPAFQFPFFQHPVGFHTAVEVRLAQGTWGRTPVGFWTRCRVPLIEGEALTPVQHAVVLADAQSGMGPPADVDHYTFVNPDLSVYFERAPEGEWIGFDIRSVTGPQGSGLAHSTMRDREGSIGICAQSMVVAPR